MSLKGHWDALFRSMRAGKKPLGRAARGVEREVYYKHVGPRFVNVTYAPDKDKFGCVSGWVASITDINNADVAD
jgi:hypothetical protein